MKLSQDYPITVRKHSRVLIVFRREFHRGILVGMKHADKLRFVDRWHAAQWLKGIRRNSRRNVLDYRVTSFVALPVNS